MNQSDCETTPELLYTTPCFVTMESRPRGEGEGQRRRSLHRASTSLVSYTTISPGGEGEGRGEGEGDGRTRRPLEPTRSHTLPASSTEHQHRGKKVDHCGYLTKLDSRLRPGKRRWFVLAGQELRYYRSKEASLGRPRKVINLNSWCKLAIINDVIFKLMTSLQTFHLSGGSPGETEGWAQALRSVLRRPSETPPHHIRSPSAPSLSGWALMSENGGTKKVWCQLDTSGTLSISPQPLAEPVQRVNVAVSSVRKLRDSLLMDSRDSSSSLSSQLAIQPEGQGSPLLLAPCTTEDKETWFYQLSLASRQGREQPLELTPTEQYLATIFREGGDLGESLHTAGE
jgi:hypothetical protein